MKKAQLFGEILVNLITNISLRIQIFFLKRGILFPHRS